MASISTERTRSTSVSPKLEQYFPFLDELPHFAWVTDPRGKVLYFNQWAREYTGVDLNQHRADCWPRILHSNDRTLIQRLAGGMAPGSVTDEECRLRRADGEYRWHRIRWNIQRHGMEPREYALGCLTEPHPPFSPSNPLTGFGPNLPETERSKYQHALLASEECFRIFMDNCPAVALIKDESGRYIYVNAAWLKQFSPEPTEWFGKTDYDFWPKETAELFRDSDRHCLTHNETSHWEETAITPTRGEVTWWVMKFPLIEDGRRFVGCIAWDVTDRYLSESAVQLLHRAMEAVPQGILITDANLPDMPVIYANPAFEQITGYPITETIGTNCRFLQGPGTDPDALATIRRGIRDRTPVSVELLNYRKDGRSFINALSVSPVYTAGRLTHFVGIASDVTERRNMEEQFRHSQKMEAVGILAGGISHDFNNLLTVILGYCDLVHEALPESPIREHVREIRSAGRRAAALTRQLLAFSRKTALEPCLLDVNALVENMGNMLRRLIGDEIEFITELDPDLGHLKADPGQLEQAVMNLCINARDAMPQGGRLTVGTRGSVSTATIFIRDTGKGMTEEVKARAFEPFFTTKDPGRGTGLGLALVFSFVQQSGGRIELLSEPDQGTEFQIHLPRNSEPENQAGSAPLP